MFFLRSLIVFHFLVIFGNLAALIALPFMEPWYISCPLMSLIVNLMFSPLPCPLTRLEDSIRRKHGLREIKHFMGYYLIHPLRNFLRSRR